MGKIINESDEKYLIARFNSRCEELGYHSFVQDILNHEIPSMDDIHVNQLTDKMFLWFRTGEDTMDGFYDDAFVRDGIHRAFSQYPMRDAVIHNVGFTIPTKEWIQALYHQMTKICKTTKVNVLEICCGLGAIAAGLRACGANVIATDLMTENYNFDYDTNSWIHDIEKLDWVEAVEKYGADVDFLLCSWPREGVTAPVKRLYELNPNAVVVYIGEGQSGCTADDKFFESVRFLDDGVYDTEMINDCLPRWYGFHDCVHFLRYDLETGCAATDSND